MKTIKMKRARSAEGNTAWDLTKDMYRLIQPMEFSYRAGGWMIRKSPKAALYTAGIASTGFITNKVGLPGFSGLETVLAPPAVGLGVLALGAAVKYIPNTLSSKMVTIADANDLNKMEKLKELQSWEHLDVLWDMVFGPESYMRYSSEERRKERERIYRDREYITNQIRGWDKGILKDLCIIDENGAWDPEALEDSAWNLMCARPWSKKAEKSRIGFKISAMYALDLPFIASRRHGERKRTGPGERLEGVKLRRSVTNDEDRVGFSLELYKDWLDGAYFDGSSDRKVNEQYHGHDTLNMFVKKELGFGRMDALKEMPGDFSRRFWFHLVTKRVAYETGKAVKWLDERYKTDKFNALVLLWPGEEHAEWLDKFPGARDDVLRWRKLIIRKTFGKDYGTARELINRAFSPDFESATNLRLLYDPEYWGNGCGFRDDVTGVCVPNNFMNDLVAENGYSPDTIERASLQGNEMAEDSGRFLDYLSHSRQDVFDDPESRRAAGIAFHINKGGLRDSFLSPSRKDRLIGEALDEAAEARETYTNNLILVRQHHAVSLLQLRGYRDLVKELGY